MTFLTHPIWRIICMTTSLLYLSAGYAAVNHLNNLNNPDKGSQKELIESIDEGESVSEKVNINTADAKQLQTLKGIGSSKAQAIIDYRNAHGAFKTVDELVEIKGFSEKTVASLQKKNGNRIVVE